MTQEEIIRMAREAGVIPSSPYAMPFDNQREALESFAALVAAHEREKQPEHFAKAIAELVECCKVLAEENETAVLAEREACAKVCDGVLGRQNGVSAAIRARGEK